MVCLELVGGMMTVCVDLRRQPVTGTRRRSPFTGLQAKAYERILILFKVGILI